MNIICDRGSNFVCAFKDFEPVFCFGHRLNNIIKISFFQNQRKKKKNPRDTHDLAQSFDPKSTSKSTANGSTKQNSESSSSDTESSEDDNLDNTTALPVIRGKKTKTINSSKNQLLALQVKMNVDEIPLSAKHVIRVLNTCKKIVKYVKKVFFFLKICLW